MARFFFYEGFPVTRAPNPPETPERPEPIQGTSSLVEQRLVQAAGDMVPPTLTLIEVPEMMA